jgi:S-disulfanyl-L-cysteine oxidoreductase SoxD
MDWVIRLVGRVVLGVLATATLVSAAAAQDTAKAGNAPERSTVEGVYTAAQADAGEAVFTGTCAACHPTSQFRGAAFQRTWHGQSVFAFYDQLRMMMPMDNPGGLSNEEYAAVVAYILRLNAYPAGEEPLPTGDSALKRIRFESVPPDSR